MTFFVNRKEHFARKRADRRNRLPHIKSLTFTRPGAEFVGQAVLPASPPSGLFSYLQVSGKLLKLDRVESEILKKTDEDRTVKGFH